MRSDPDPQHWCMCLPSVGVWCVSGGLSDPLPVPSCLDALDINTKYIGLSREGQEIVLKERAHEILN